MKCIKKLLVGVFLILGIYSRVLAQLSSNDSLTFQNIFSANTYLDSIGQNLIGNWFVQKPVTSVAQLHDLLNEQFKFQTADLHAAYAEMELTSSLETDQELTSTYNFYRQYIDDGLFGTNGSVAILDFELDNETGRSYAYKNAKQTSGATSTAFLIIPGTGNNQSSQIVRGQGYHSLYCNIRDMLDDKGDVYTYCKPNEDFRAIRWNNKKLNGAGPGYIYDYTDSTENYYCVTYLIECIAMVKKLKQTYSKVVVLGLSQGGEASLVVSLLANPDASIVSAGYSIEFDTVYPISSPDTKSGNIYFDDFLTWFSRDSVRSHLSQSSTQYLFTYGSSDYGWCCGPQEEAFKVTELFLAGLNNVSFYTNFVDHAFPCEAIDSVTNNLLFVPKCKIALDTVLCSMDSGILEVELSGKLPIQGELYVNDTFVQTILFENIRSRLSITKGGRYSIRNLIDAESAVVPNSQEVLFIPDPKVNLLVTDIDYNCITDSLSLHFDLSGTGPWSIQYLAGDSIISEPLAQSEVVWPNANYVIQHIADNQGCKKTLNQVIAEIPQTTARIADVAFLCESQQSALGLSLTGSAPWTVFWNHTNGADSLLSYESFTNIGLPNGITTISKVEDSNGCSVRIDSTITINNPTPQFTMTQSGYRCDSGLTVFECFFVGKSPWTVTYSSANAIYSRIFSGSNGQLMLSNGEYKVHQIVDGNGCAHELNQLYTVNENPVGYQMLTLSEVCHSAQRQTVFKLSGKGPWQVNYVADQIQFDTQFVNNVNALFFEHDSLLVREISDANGCHLILNKTYSMSDSLITYALGKNKFNCDSGKTELDIVLGSMGPWVLTLENNGVSDDVVLFDYTNTLLLTNGQYLLKSYTDSLGCNFPLDQEINIDNHLPSFTIDSGNFDCGSGKTLFDISTSGKAPFQLSYVLNGYEHHQLLLNSTEQLLLLKGNYQLVELADANSCVLNMNDYLVVANELPSFTIKGQQFVCDSAKTNIRFDAGGRFPLTLFLQRNGQLDSIVIVSGGSTIWLNNGHYNLISVTDISGCSVLLNDSFDVQHHSLSYQEMSRSFVCDSTARELVLDILGEGTRTLFYRENGISRNIDFDSNNAQLYLHNGMFVMEKVKDGNGCLLVINDTMVIDDCKAAINSLQQHFVCDSAKTKVELSLRGIGPWAVTYCNVNAFDTITTVNTSSGIYLPGGNYKLLTATDAIGCNYLLNETVIDCDTMLSFSQLSKQFLCQQNKTQVDILLTGKSPWQLSYQENSLNQEILVTEKKAHLKLANGAYFFNKVQDANGCNLNINSGVQLNESLPHFRYDANGYSCDSGSVEALFNFSGRAPWRLTYSLNEVVQYDTIQESNHHAFLSNGSYVFSHVVDSNGCGFLIDTAFVINESHLNFEVTGQVYVCDSSASRIDLSFKGQSPWLVTFEHDGVVSQEIFVHEQSSIYRSNGLYQVLSITDAMGRCILSPGSMISVNEEHAGVSVEQMQYNCDSLKTESTLLLSGKAPWNLSLTKDSDLFEVILLNAQSSLFLPNGDYSFVEVKDGNGCVTELHQRFLVEEPIPSVSLFQTSYSCETNSAELLFHSTGEYPMAVYYRKNMDSDEQAFILSDTAKITGLTNGLYHIQKVVDNRGCELLMDTNFAIEYSKLTAVGNILTLDCETGTAVLGLNLNGKKPFDLQTNNNGVLKSFKADTNQLNITFSLGEFKIKTVVDANGCVLNDAFRFNNDSVFTNNNTGIYLLNDEVITDNRGLWYVWYYNHQKVDSSVISSTQYKGDGYYGVEVFTATDCRYVLPDMYLMKTVGEAETITMEHTIDVFPNPFTNNLQVDIPSSLSGQIVTVYNMMGKEMMQVKVHAGVNSINTEILPNGMYFLKMSGVNNQRMLKVLKVNGQ